VVSGGIAVLAERIAYRPFRRGGASGKAGLAPLISTLGLSFVLEYSARGMFGAQNKAFPSMPLVDGEWVIAGLSVPRSQIVVVAAALLAMLVLTLIVMRTRIGTAMRAVAEDRDAATLMGINVDRVIVFTFVLGGSMAGVAGLLYGLVFKEVTPFLGFFLGVKGFGAAVLGGIGNIPGAALGGILLGVIETLVVGYSDRLHIPSGYRDAVAFFLLILILLFKPTGLLGRVEREKV
jgi:branched-chain amino acid transport system permease protein